MFQWYWRNFKLEMFVVVICLAVSIGLVVQRMPQAAIHQTTTKKTPTDYYDECQQKMRETRLWAETNGPNWNTQQWDEAQKTFVAWVGYCRKALPTYQLPFDMAAVRQEVEAKKAKPVVVVVTKQEPQPKPLTAAATDECTVKMEEFRGWFSRFNEWARKNRPVNDPKWQEAVQTVESVSQWQKKCKAEIPGWKAPYTATADSSEKLVFVVHHQ